MNVFQRKEHGKPRTVLGSVLHSQSSGKHKLNHLEVPFTPVRMAANKKSVNKLLERMWGRGET